MTFRSLAIQSIGSGLMAVLLWVVIWTLAFPKVWDGYENYILGVFWVGTAAGLAVGIWVMLSKRR